MPQEEDHSFDDYLPLSAERIAPREYMITAKDGRKLGYMEGRSLVEWFCASINSHAELLAAAQAVNSESAASGRSLAAGLKAENECLKRLLATAHKELEAFYAVEAMMPVIESLSRFLDEIQTGKKPLLTRLVVRTQDRAEIPILSLWAAYGEQNPIGRIEELNKEIAELKGIK